MMIRTPKITKNPDLILTSDWHLREDTPICRTDDYYATQWRKVDFISELQKKYNCPVIHAGDLFDYWKPSPMLISDSLIHLPDNFHTVYGNHDLPQHNLELAYKCGIYTLIQAGKINIKPISRVAQVSWGEEIPKHGYTDILLWHTSVYQTKENWMSEAGFNSAAKLLRKYSDYDLIVTGDNHKPFVEEYQGRLLVNPGSIMRMDADQINHRPRVYLWFADTNTVEPMYIPIENNVISREHLEIKQQRESRIDAFISKLDGDWSASMSFESNLLEFEKSNNIRKDIMDIVYKAIE